MWYRFCTLLTLALSSLAAAQTTVSGVKIDAQAGVGDIVRPGAMVPIQVTLTNGETAHNGRLRAAFTGAGADQTVVERSVDLAPGAVKRVWLYLPAPAYSFEYKVWYESERGRRVGELRQNVRPVDASTPMIAAVGVLPRGLPLDESPEGRATLYTRVMLRPDNLPDRHEGLEMFDVLFLSPALELPLARGQVAAIEDWVLRGGLLIVDASRRTDAYVSGRMAELLPFSPRAQEQRRLSLFGSEVLLAAGDSSQGRVVLESDGMPLVVKRNYGLGCIVAFAVAPDDPEFVGWPGSVAFWRELLYPVNWDKGREQLGFIQIPYGNNLANQLAESVSGAPSAGLRLGMVLLLTGLYALIAGPGDYWLVRRLKRPKLTWITFPVIVAFFTFVAYFGARFWIGGDWEVRHRQRILVFPEQNLALKYDLTGVFVPRADDYMVRGPGGALVRHLGDMYGLTDRLTIHLDDNALTHRIPIWTHRAYVTSGTTTDYPDVHVEFQRNGTGFDIRVVNRSPLTLNPVRVSHADTARFVVARPIAPGEERVLTLDAEGRRYQDAQLPDGAQTVSAAQGEPLIFLASGRVGDDSGPFGRELNERAALKRGAVLITFDAAGPGSPLEFADQPASAAYSTLTFQVLAYPGGAA